MDYALALHYAQANHGSAAPLKLWEIEKTTLNTVEPFG